MYGRAITDAKIMLVDDLDTNIGLMTSILRRGGYTNVVFTTDSTAALARFDEESPDLVVLDLHMPGLNGLEVLELISARFGPGEYLPVLVITADSTPETRELALELGAHDFLAKPLNYTEILLRTRNLLRTRWLHLEKADILASTLSGVVQILVQVIESSHPAARARTARVRELAQQVAANLALDDPWQLDLAAMLGRLGLLTMPATTVAAALEGRYLVPDEARAVARQAKAGSELIRKIPRLEAVADIIAMQQHVERRSGTRLPEPQRTYGAILKAVDDFEQLTAAGIPGRSALVRMADREGWYDEQVLGALREIAARAA